MRIEYINNRNRTFETLKPGNVFLTPDGKTFLRTECIMGPDDTIYNALVLDSKDDTTYGATYFAPDVVVEYIPEAKLVI